MIETKTIKESDTFRRHGTEAILTVTIKELENCLINDGNGNIHFYLVGVQRYENHKYSFDSVVYTFGEFKSAKKKYSDWCKYYNVAEEETFVTEKEVYNV